MNKFTSSLVLTAVLALGWTAADAAPIAQSLDPTSLSASTFNSLYDPIATAPEMNSNFEFQGAPISGVVQSQVFQGKAGTSAAGLYAYAYQIGVNSTGLDSTGNPAHVDSASFHFGSALTGAGAGSHSYVITDGTIGALTLPPSAQTPGELSWESQPGSGILRAKFQDSASGASSINAGGNSSTFIVLSNQAPSSQTLVNLQSADPQIAANGVYTAVYAPSTGMIEPIPVPEPATVLAWAGVLGTIALVRRARKGRPALA